MPSAMGYQPILMARLICEMELSWNWNWKEMEWNWRRIEKEKNQY